VIKSINKSSNGFIHLRINQVIGGNIMGWKNGELLNEFTKDVSSLLHGSIFMMEK